MNRLLLQQTRSPVTQGFLGAARCIGSCSISIICGAVSSERCCKALQHMSELILQRRLDATPHFKMLQGREKKTQQRMRSSTGAEQGSAERKFLYL